MNDFIKSQLLPSLIRIFSWIKMPLIGFLIGIILYAVFICVNPDMKIFSLDMAILTNGTLAEIIGIVTVNLIKILLITIICLVIPSIKYGIAIGRTLILMISVYLGRMLI